MENAYYPWIAFAETVEFAGTEFEDVPFHLAESNIRLLTLSELQQDCQGSVSKPGKADMGTNQVLEAADSGRDYF